jgi:hypothetical protein
VKALRSVLVAFLSLPFAASAANAVTVEVSDDHGGILPLYQARWHDLAEQNVRVEIVGPCVSACTILFGYIPSQKICVTPNASLGFHLATMQFATDALWKAYPDAVRDWITKHGGLTHQLLWLKPPEIFHFFRKC